MDIDIIDNYRNLSIGKYQQILTINADDRLGALAKQAQTISVLTGISEEEVYHLPIEDYKTCVRKAAFLEGTVTNMPRLAKRYVVGQFKLVPVTDYRKLEAAQFIDYQTYAPDSDRRIAELVSVFLVPEGHRYNEGYDILDVQQAIHEHMNVADGVAVTAFFLTSLQRSLQATLNSCKQELKRLKTDKVEREKLMRQIQALERSLRTSGLG